VSGFVGLKEGGGRIKGTITNWKGLEAAIKKLTRN